ncbi:hypothetical protein [Paenibacillus sp. 481]|uniref:hypothetical protein n=1 Tax=Paenibacillus sp. 481 TaxID=2835869 RepID=UPI001E5FEAD1|nr:hypothetical protein [Paenibacillus sp. 481]UHA73840.1 hypothetical protein KIK04_01330 [Paenibacillus sp. 481]
MVKKTIRLHMSRAAAAVALLTLLVACSPQEKLESAVNKGLEDVNSAIQSIDVSKYTDPMEYIKSNQQLIDDMIAKGDESLKEIVAQFEQTKTNGMEEWVLAYVGNQLLPQPIEGWETGREWYEQYVAKFVESK